MSNVSHERCECNDIPVPFGGLLVGRYIGSSILVVVKVLSPGAVLPSPEPLPLPEPLPSMNSITKEKTSFVFIFALIDTIFF